MKKFIWNWAPELGSAVLFIVGIAYDHFHQGISRSGVFCNDVMPLWRFVFYFLAFLPVAWPVVKEAFDSFRQRDFFNEFTLMLLASVGAFYIGEYPEAVGVMLFYAVGEKLQGMAVRETRANIASLLQMHPDRVRVWRDGRLQEVEPEKVNPGEEIEVAVGEKTCLDGVLLSDDAVLNTAALTGESLPREIRQGAEVPAGCVAEQHTLRIRVVRPYSDSALSRMARLVEEASRRKSKTEIFIRRVAHVYTPVVMGAAILVVLIPFLVSLLGTYCYDFSTWLYRALVFLVISCPCALVVSIPLSYFAGIGAASKKGILFKGGNGLDAAAQINAAVFDKTGTLTTGRFTVAEVVGMAGKPASEVQAAPSTSAVQGLLSDTWAGFSDIQTGSSDTWFVYMAVMENSSRHPLAKAIVEYAVSQGVGPGSALWENACVGNVQEVPGKGLQARLRSSSSRLSDTEGAGQNQRVAGEAMEEDVCLRVGNLSFLKENGVEIPREVDSLNRTLVALAVGARLMGYVVLEDRPKEDAALAMQRLQVLGVEPLAVLSGDHPGEVERVAALTGVHQAHGGLLPEDKLEWVHRYSDQGYKLAFVGDGINDSPVLAASHLGVAMGRMGSDVAIETADMVLQTDELGRLADAVELSRKIRRRIWQNVIFAFGVKFLVMVLGVLDMANLWAAVFSDTVVAMLAVLNAVRGMGLLGRRSGTGQRDAA